MKAAPESCVVACRRVIVEGTNKAVPLQVQCVAVCCRVLHFLQFTAVLLRVPIKLFLCGYSVMQRGAVCCSVLRFGAVWCSVLQCVAVWCSLLQCR